MSPLLKEYYAKKNRTMAFYIVENDKVNEENPPEVSAIIGLDNFFASEKSMKTPYGPKDYQDKHPPMKLANKEDKDIFNNIKQEDPNPKNEYKRRPKIKCPSIPIQWDSNIGKRIPTFLC